MALTERDVTTGIARLSYEHIFQPYVRNANDTPKYSATILVPKSDTATKARLDAAIEAAKRAGMKDKFGGMIPPFLTTPLHDGDGVRPSDGMPYGQECKGHWVFTANAKNPPSVVDMNRQPIVDESEIYSGVYAYVNVTFFPYNSNSKKGIGCGLNAVMKARDGEPLGSHITVDDAFAGLPMMPTAAAPAVDPITGLPVTA